MCPRPLAGLKLARPRAVVHAARRRRARARGRSIASSPGPSWDRGRPRDPLKFETSFSQNLQKGQNPFAFHREVAHSAGKANRTAPHSNSLGQGERNATPRAAPPPAAPRPDRCALQLAMAPPRACSSRASTLQLRAAPLSNAFIFARSTTSARRAGHCEAAARDRLQLGERNASRCAAPRPARRAVP